MVPARGPRIRGNARRVEAPERGPDRCEENALKGEARGRSSLRKEARRVGGGRRDGGSQTPDVARRGAGSLAYERIRRPGTCRGAPKPRRGSIVRRLGPSGSGGTVRGCCDGPLKRSESVGGAHDRSDPAREARSRASPEGVKTPSGPTEPMSVQRGRVGVLGAPRNLTRGPVGRRKASAPGRTTAQAFGRP